jgi:hypothetical protein
MQLLGRAMKRQLLNEHGTRISRDSIEVDESGKQVSQLHGE